VSVGNALVLLSPAGNELIEFLVLHAVVNLNDSAWPGTVDEEVPIPLRAVACCIDVIEHGLNWSHTAIRVSRIRVLQMNYLV
jgi:hypothetical protein